MTDVICVRVEELDSIFYLSPNGLDLSKDDIVVFEADDVLLCGKVCKEIYSEKNKNLDFPLNKVLRIATKNDLKQVQKNKEIAEKALGDAKEFSHSLDLDMNFIDSYYYFDKSQLIFCFFHPILRSNRVLQRKLYYLNLILNF